jgi:hypothetical protein
VPNWVTKETKATHFGQTVDTPPGKTIWIWIWISCLRFNEPCAVIPGRLLPNVKTAQNAAMTWLKVSPQTVTLQ